MKIATFIFIAVFLAMFIALLAENHSLHKKNMELHKRTNKAVADWFNEVAKREAEENKREADQEGWSKAVELLEQCVNSKGFSANQENPYALIEEFKGSRLTITNNVSTNRPPAPINLRIK